MKKNNLTVKTFFYFIIFSVIILLSLWFIQIRYLDLSYEKYQMNTVNKLVKDVKNNSITLEKMQSYAYENNICVQFYLNNEVLNYNDKVSGCLLTNDDFKLNNYLNDLMNSKDGYIKLTVPKTNIKSILYYVDLGNNKIMFLSSTLEDLSSATRLLKERLIYVVLILILFSILMAIFISRRINKPIISIINTSKELKRGNYNVEFKKSGIAELDELSNVLTVAASEMNKTEELRRDLIANVSHDLKTPLTMIKAYAEKIKDFSHQKKDVMNNDLDVIINETNRLNILVNDLLDLTKLENNVQKMNIEEYDLVSEVIRIVKSYEIIKETENYNFEVDIPDIAIVYADKSKINQVIYNLINNAIEHTGDDLTVKINISEEKDSFLVSISDSGKGLTEEEMSLVWNKYYKKEKRHKRNIIGSGIGLSIVKHVLEAHNFEYGIDSKINEYTTFYFKIKKNKKS